MGEPDGAGEGDGEGVGEPDGAGEGDGEGEGRPAGAGAGAGTVKALSHPLRLGLFAHFNWSSRPKVLVAILRIAKAESITTKPIIPKVICFTPCWRAWSLVALMKYCAHPQRNTKNATAESSAISGKRIISLNLATKEAASAAALSCGDSANVRRGRNANKDVRLNVKKDFISNNPSIVFFARGAIHTKSTRRCFLCVSESGTKYQF